MLREKLIAMYQASKCRNVKDWRDSTKCQISEETVTKILNRGHEPAPYTFMIIAYHFGANVSDIASAVKEAGATELANLLTSGGDLTADETKVLSLYRSYQYEQRKAVAQLMEHMGR